VLCVGDAVSEEARKSENCSLGLRLGHFYTVENGRFIMMQILTHLIGCGIGEKLLDIMMEILVSMARHTLITLGVQESNACFVYM